MTETAPPLYAIPDHQAAQRLLPEGFRHQLDAGSAAARIRARPGIVPLAIDPAAGGRILWADLGRRPFRESKYLSTVAALAAEGGVGENFSSGIEVLDTPDLFADSLPPSGLIFHNSRCGSTLLTKALARPEGNMMIAQGGPLQRGFWALLSDEWRRPVEPDPRTLARLRALVLAMTRPRQGHERRAFVKFISWNTLYLDLITRAFPGTPALFLYRDPVEVIARVLGETTAVLLQRGSRQAAFLTGLDAATTVAMAPTDYLAACFARYYRTALETAQPVACLNYRDLGPDRIARVMAEGFGYPIAGADLDAAREQFKVFSKDEGASPRAFSAAAAAAAPAPLSEAERTAIEARCVGLIARLDASPRNLFPRPPAQ